MIEDIICFPKLAKDTGIDVYLLIHKWHDIYNHVHKEYMSETAQTIYKMSHQRLMIWMKAYKR